MDNVNETVARLRSSTTTSIELDYLKLKNSSYSESFVIIGIFFFATLAIWIVNRSSFKIKIVGTLSELITSWILAFVFSPLIVFPLAVSLCWRLLTAIRLKLQFGRKVFLVDPCDSIWGFERPGSTSTADALYIIEGHGDLENVRNSMLNRIINREVDGEKIYERFRWCLRRIHGFVCWERLNEFDVNTYIDYFSKQSKTRKNPEKLWTEQDVFEELQNCQDISIDRKNRSPWEILVVPRYDYANGEAGKDYYAIIVRIHHCLMDGVSAGNLLYYLADKPFAFTIDPIAPTNASKFVVWMTYVMGLINLPRLMITNLYLVYLEKKKFPVKVLTGPKTFNWSRPIRLNTIKQLKTLTKTSMFSVLFSCLGGAMRKLYLKNNYSMPDVIHACPPTAILPYPDRKPRNRFSFVFHPLAIGKDTVMERLNCVYSESNKLASSSQAIAMFYLVNTLGILPNFILPILAPLSHATMTFSNTPGPKQKVKVMNGDTLVEIGFWVPIKMTIGIGMAMFSYDDRFRVTFIGDRATLPNPGDLQFLQDEFENELTLLAQEFKIESEELFFGDNKILNYN